MEIVLIFEHEWPNHHNRHQHKPIKNHTSLDFIATHECESCFLHSDVTSKCTKVTGVKGLFSGGLCLEWSCMELMLKPHPTADNQD